MINKELRFYYNSNIINKLSELVNKYPDLRFHQILWKLKIFETTEDGYIMDKFYEEPETTWKRIVELENK